ncbi:MAG TPA: zinc ABC transporter substrate-binding protein [Candidatus Baltobacteraceae bacterium]|jgi:zinc/manganese transport system substrate-binding protein
MISVLALAVNIVAAENFYGDVARQIGGDHVSVTSILNNPDQDPHLFEASPSVARAISSAQIVVSNGLDYDPWVDKLLSAARNPHRTAIIVGNLVLKKPGDNPHVWYDPQTMLAYAKALTGALAQVDPANAKAYALHLGTFERSLRPIETRIASLHKRFAGMPVTATEPVFGYMLDALGLQIRNTRFQTAVMNNTEPGALEVARFENDLKTHQVRMLVYNSQASDPVAQRMLDLAKASGIPVVGATETEPPGTMYQAWMSRELDAVENAL